jgi:hypothetical protein
VNNSAHQLLTIVTESALEPALIEDIELLGANGYTIVDARGKGHKGVRSGGWDANANIRVEVICSNDVADKISKHLQEKYYKDYAMVLFSHDVNVLRPEKF